MEGGGLLYDRYSCTSVSGEITSCKDSAFDFISRGVERRVAESTATFDMCIRLARLIKLSLIFGLKPSMFSWLRNRFIFVQSVAGRHVKDEKLISCFLRLVEDMHRLMYHWTLDIGLDTIVDDCSLAISACENDSVHQKKPRTCSHSTWHMAALTGMVESEALMGND